MPTFHYASLALRLTDVDEISFPDGKSVQVAVGDGESRAGEWKEERLARLRRTFEATIRYLLGR